MIYLLDTNACIKFLNGSSEAILYKLELTNPNDVALCSIAKANNSIFITHNIREFRRVNGLTIKDWEAK